MFCFFCFFFLTVVLVYFPGWGWFVVALGYRLLFGRGRGERIWKDLERGNMAKIFSNLKVTLNNKI